MPDSCSQNSSYNSVMLSCVVRFFYKYFYSYMWKCYGNETKIFTLQLIAFYDWEYQ